ncbi:MAG: single-stranded DNA-binding protein, partial [Desulfobacteraceae bacterium]|nr:single-stranded DNA-binding protein [Desulfobacteraceae bacterium]
MVNKVILIGRISEYPRYSSNGGKKETVFPLRTGTGIPLDWPEHGQESQYHRVIARGRNAEICKRLGKEDLIYIEGSLQTSYYEYFNNDSMPVGAFTSEVILKFVRRLSGEAKTINEQ